MEQEQPTQDQIDRYLAGQRDGDDIQHIEHYLARHPGEVAYRQALHSLLVQGCPAQGDMATEAQASFEVVEQRMARDRATRPATGSPQVATTIPARGHVAETHSPPPFSLQGRRAGVRRWPNYVLGVSAASILLAGLLWFQRPPANSETQIRTYQTRFAQRADITLPDGSRVQLAPGTQVRYSASNGTRVVDVTGQARFTVTHDPKRTFVVRAGGAMTQVLGTIFDVRRYAADSVTQVAVMEGRVSLHASQSHVVLLPGMVGYLADSSAVPSVGDDVGGAASWVSGELIFRRAPVSTVLASAERWSGYQFRVTDSALVRQRVTTALPVYEPKRILQFLADLLDVTMTVEGDTVTLRARRGARKPDSAAIRDGAYPWPTRTEVGR